MTTESQFSTFALEYGYRGWRVVPLHTVIDGRCTCGNRGRCGNEEKNRGKHPRIKEWQKEASADEDVIAEWFDRWPESNIGVQMGRESGIVDFETDSPEGEQLLIEMFGGSIPVTATFTSGRGKHRLFKWRDDLPSKATVPLAGVDIKLGSGAKGSQSVFPPSRHYSGQRYRWLIPPRDADPAEIPNCVIAWLWNRADGETEDKPTRPPSVRQKLYTQPVVQESVDGRDNVLQAEAWALWREQYQMYGAGCFADPARQTTVYQRLWAWNRAKFQPPLDDEEVLDKCERARTDIQSRLEDEQKQSGPNLTALGLEFRDGEWWPGNWKVEVIRCDPRKVRLHAPFLPKKFVEMTMLEYDSPQDVHLAVLCETGTVCLNNRPGFWTSVWNGTAGSKKEGRLPTMGVKAKLLEGAQWIEAPREMSREYVIAERFHHEIAHARALKDGEHCDHRGRPVIDHEGNILFGFGAIFENMAMSSDKITRNELSEFLRDIGVKDKQVRATKGPVRQKVLTPQIVSTLEAKLGMR